jgi:hypothetical protein
MKIPKIKNMFLITAIVIVSACLLAIIKFEFFRILTDIYSLFQLLLTAYVASLIYKVIKQKDQSQEPKKYNFRPFLISAWGFLFLAMDEIFSIHENIDKLMHYLLRVKETAQTDHWDDYILAAYGVIALIFFIYQMREFMKYPRSLKMMLLGFALFFMMSFLDYYSNNDETFYALRSKAPVLRIFPDIKTANMVEESAEILAETFFLAAFLSAHFWLKREAGEGKN